MQQIHSYILLIFFLISFSRFIFFIAFAVEMQEWGFVWVVFFF